MSLRFIVLCSGYAEDATTSVLIYQCEFSGHPGYSNYKDAVTDLALDLYAKYYDSCLNVYENRYSADVKQCCRNALIENNKANFCSKCGNEIADKKFSADGFCSYIRGLYCTTSDSYGEAEHANGRNLIWWPFWIEDFIGAPKEDIITIGENGQAILLEALLEAKPELRQYDEEDFLASEDWEEFKNK